MIVGALIVILATTIGAAALGPQANPLTPANPKPDWYLIWYFAVLALIPPASTPYVIILAPAVGFGILFLFPLANKGERHYSKRPWAVATVIIAAFATIFLIDLGYTEPWKPFLLNGTTPPSLPASATQNLGPAAAAGAELMQVEACTACHTINGVGGQRGPNLSFVGDRLSPDEMIQRITFGGGGMPAYGPTLSPREVGQLVAYLQTRTAAPRQAAPSSGGAPPRSRAPTAKSHRKNGH
jgi:ubiquinol-cytochrome c reductase cytochrome b subunit